MFDSLAKLFLFGLLVSPAFAAARDAPAGRRPPRAEPWQGAQAAAPGECEKTQAALPSTLEALRATSGRPTPALLRRSTTEVGLFARLCAQTDAETHSLLSRVWDASGPRLQRRFLSPEFLLRIQAPGLTRELGDGELHLLLHKSLKKRASRIAAAARDGECRPGTFQEYALPKTSDCFVDWLHWRAVRVDRAHVEENETKAFLAESLQQLREVLSETANPPLHIPFSWTLHSAEATFKGPSPLSSSGEAMALLLGAGEAGSRASLLRASAAHLPSFFPLGYKTPYEVSCDRATALAQALTTDAPPSKPKSSKPTSSEGALAQAAVFLSRAALDVCSVTERTKPLSLLRTAMKKDANLSSPSSSIEGLSILNVAETDSRADLLLRDLLGLRTQLGSPYDLEDLSGAPAEAGVEFVRDNALADAVRRVRPEWPWIHLAESVEDSEHQEKRLALVWNLLTKSKAPDANALKLRQLETDLLGPFSRTTEERAALVNRLRAISSAGKAEIPALFPLGFRIHNSASPTLLDAIDAFPAVLPDAKSKADVRPFLVGLRKQLVELYGLRSVTPDEVFFFLGQAGEVLSETEANAFKKGDVFAPASKRLATLLEAPLPEAEGKRLAHWKAIRVLWAEVKASPECRQESSEKLAWAERASRFEMFLATQAARRTRRQELREVRTDREKAFPKLALAVASEKVCLAKDAQQ